jgi:hypothetical protein
MTAPMAGWCARTSLATAPRTPYSERKGGGACGDAASLCCPQEEAEVLESTKISCSFLFQKDFGTEWLHL